MRYLCPHHLKTISADPVMAMTLWRNAMDNGLEAQMRKEWQTARNYFGAAFETALLHSQRDLDSQDYFSLCHLIDSSQRLVDVLKELKHWEEAQLCLLTLQHNLLRETKSNTKNGYCPEQMLARTQQVVEEFLKGSPGEIADEGTVQQNCDLKSEIDLLLSSALFLMTRYAHRPTHSLGILISDHFKRIINHPSCNSPVLAKTCQQLSTQWRHLECINESNTDAPVLISNFVH